MSQESLSLARFLWKLFPCHCLLVGYSTTHMSIPPALRPRKSLMNWCMCLYWHMLSSRKVLLHSRLWRHYNFKFNFYLGCFCRFWWKSKFDLQRSVFNRSSSTTGLFSHQAIHLIIIKCVTDNRTNKNLVWVGIHTTYEISQSCQMNK